MSKGKSITGRRKQQGIYQERSGFSPWLQQYANLGADSNGGIWSGAIGRGAGFSNTQLAEMQFNHDEAQIDRQFQEDMYNKYQSPEAQMRQYQAAGLNPALMYEGGVDINGPSGGSAASVSGAVGGDSPSNGFEQVMGIMSQFMNMITGASNIGNQVMQVKNQTAETKATVAEKRAHADNLEADTEGKRLGNQITAAFGMARAFYENKQLAASIKQTYQNIRESASRIDLNNSTIELNGEKIQVAKSEAELNWAKANLTKFNEEQGRKLLEPSLKLLRAQIYLVTAQGEKTSEEAAQVELSAVSKRNAEYAQAAKDMAQAAVTQGLLDADYCKTFVEYYNKQGDSALINAYSNWRNAGTNERNAATNERNADTNERNAATNERNADTNEENAVTNRIKAVSSIVFGAIHALSNLSIAVVPGASAACGLPALPGPSPLPLPPM
nr:MAG TPA: DNA pilot protein VP2 [Microviridae sp.]